MKLVVNEKEVEVNPPEGMPLLWVLRDLLGYTGTKFGCGVSQCGACTVHLDGKAVRSCVTPAAAVGTRKITTIEGISAEATHPVQRAWAEVDVGAVPPLAIFRNSVVIASYRPSSAAVFGGIPLAARISVGVTLVMPCCSA